MTPTREAALEAALKLARNRLQACAIDYPTGSREMAERSEWADEATAALSTPATEPQGYVEGLGLKRIVEEVDGAMRHGTWRDAHGMRLKDTPEWVAFYNSLPARPAPQPAADMRVVVKPLVWVPEDAPCTRFKAEALGGHMMIVELDPKTDPGKYSVGFDLGGLCFKFVLAEYDDFPPKYTAPAKFDGIEAAKAAAQADYETRIMSAIIGTAAPAPSDKIAEAARNVLAERQRQISAEGWTPEHDDQHSSGQMALAAACYALVGSIDRSPGAFKTPLQNWPWQASWWKPTTPRRDLVKAGALIIAEIERLDRALAGKGE